MEALPDLADIRREIDALDAKLRALLLARADLVAKVAASKAQNGGGPVLRPAREAAQMAALLAWQEADAPHLDQSGVLAIWREIIGLAIAQQGGLKIFITQASEVMARGHFGASLTYVLCDTPQEALSKLAETGEAVAVLARDEADGVDIAAYGAVQQFAGLPFADAPDAAQAFCYGRVTTDENGDEPLGDAQ